MAIVSPKPGPGLGQRKYTDSYIFEIPNITDKSSNLSFTLIYADPQPVRTPSAIVNGNALADIPAGEKNRNYVIPVGNLKNGKNEIEVTADDIYGGTWWIDEVERTAVLRVYTGTD